MGGAYSVLESAERDKMRRIVVKPDERLSLQNEGRLPLVIVEVQVGEYTGEDDIIRVEDDFHRA
jgi:mannose-6-phosphate isomerase-like protein (cupin superfamily)